MPTSPTRLFARVAIVATTLLAACGSSPPAVQHADPIVALAAAIPPEPTTTTSTTAAPRPKPRVGRAAPRPVVVAKPVPAGDFYTRLGACESGNDPTKVSSNGLFYGAFQYTLQTWRSVRKNMGATEGPGDVPTKHSYAEQLKTIKFHVADPNTNPFKQWPTCWPRALRGATS